MTFRLLAAIAFVLLPQIEPALGASGDPQIRTDHPWYPGELAYSTYERLFKTQAELYTRVTGRDVSTDEDKALAAWYWRNLHFAHGEEGKNDCFAAGYPKGETTREYWTGLFSHGFALCGTTHSQWTAEMNVLLGQCRGRVVGVSGHNSFEVYLTGGAYGEGRWALLDHDVSSVIFTPDGKRLASIDEVRQDLKNLKSPAFKPERQRGWRVAGLHDGDTGVFDAVNTAEYLSGYAGPPPMVQLRAGETLRRYLQPGIDDGKTFVFWGRNYKRGDIPGLERDRTWINQPEKMFKSKNGTGGQAGRVRFANAVFTYTPDFASGTYKEGVVDEGPDRVTFEFRSPYIIGCTPGDETPWGIYAAGGKNGLVLRGSATCPVQLSTDDGATWQDCGALADGMDLTDRVKGLNQYRLRFMASAEVLKGAKLSWRTVCQANVATMPRLKDGENKITFAASGLGIVSAGPFITHATTHLVDGKMGSPTATLELAAPRGEELARVYAAGWVASGNPPAPVKFNIEYSVDAGKTWAPVVKDWTIVRRAYEPKDFWSQSFCWGEIELPAGTKGPVRVRFSNSGGKQFRKVEAHLAYKVTTPAPTEVTFGWTEGGEAKTATHTFPAGGQEDSSWSITTGKNVETKWIEYGVK